ncbi:hypothetical protein Tco_1020194 [Tanacetum coccineum]|uniref:Uncharacterized protein n=1 Tax=Tanacetum coccineum TaxID=301880 RepID=A0ABQ5FZR1_9ASTR
MINMPKGAKVLKDLLSHKEKLEKVASSVKLKEECLAVIQRSLPQKEGNPGSFTLPCLIRPLCMTRSSTNELFTPFENSKREFRSSRKLFKTPGLDESSLPEFDLFSDLEENSKKEVAETMAETMEQYMSKTQARYRSGVTRPKIDDKDHFELKG